MTNLSAGLGFCVLTVVLCTSVGLAHDGPHHTIIRLTTQVDSTGATARLLVRRADEWRVLGQVTRAVSDYRQALDKSPASLAALHGLAECELALERFASAARLAGEGATVAPSPDQASPFHALVAQAQQRLGNDTAARAAWEKSLRSSRPEVDWLLAHAKTLQRLNRHDEARQALERARQRNPSTVLHRAWIGSLINCGDTDAAGRAIEERLERARLKSSWLLLRARLRTACDNQDGARDDARRARDQLVARVSVGATNPILEAQIAEAESYLR